MKLINYLIDIETDLIKDYFNNGSFPVSNKRQFRKPYVNIKDNSNDYCLSLEMPGIDKKNIIITANDGIINIETQIKEDDQKENNSFYSEIERFNYSRSFYIPDDANIDKIKAKSSNGILDISIPKLKKVKKDIKKIAIS
tara:strand:+ start:354 stop:773 length:420 start_codon:yes stop_codon:yes gene_type:complete